MDSPTPRRQNIPNLGCEIEAQGNLSMEATAHPIRVQTNCTASHRIEYCDVDRIYFIPGSRPQLEALPPLGSSYGKQKSYEYMESLCAWILKWIELERGGSPHRGARKKGARHPMHSAPTALRPPVSVSPIIIQPPDGGSLEDGNLAGDTPFSAFPIPCIGDHTAPVLPHFSLLLVSSSCI